MTHYFVVPGDRESCAVLCGDLRQFEAFVYDMQKEGHRPDQFVYIPEDPAGFNRFRGHAFCELVLYGTYEVRRKLEQELEVLQYLRHRNYSIWKAHHEHKRHDLPSVYADLKQVPTPPQTPDA